MLKISVPWMPVRRPPTRYTHEFWYEWAKLGQWVAHEAGETCDFALFDCKACEAISRATDDGVAYE